MPSKVKSSKRAALQKLAKSRKGGVNQIAEYKDDIEDVYDEMDETEYANLVQSRRDQDDFVVDDDGLGYADDGEENEHAEDYDDHEYQELMEREDDSSSFQANSTTHSQKKRRVYKEGGVAGRQSVSSMLRRQKATKPSSRGKLQANVPTNDTVNVDFDAMLDELDQEEQTSRPSARNFKREVSGSMTASRNAHLSSMNNFVTHSAPTNPFDTHNETDTAAPIEPDSNMHDTESVPKQERKTQALATTEEIEPSFEPDPSRFETIAPKRRMAPVERKLLEQQKQQNGENNTGATGKTATEFPVGAWANAQSSASTNDTTEIPLPAELTLYPFVTPPSKKGKKMKNETVTEAAEPSTVVDSDTKDCFRMFWFDAYEDPKHNPGTLFLFGKTIVNEEAARKGRSEGWASVCVQVSNLQRYVYVLPRQELFDQTTGKNPLQDVYGEMKSHLDRVIPKDAGASFRCKAVTRNYAFELPDVPHNEAKYLKIVYPACYPPLPSNLTGKYFSRAFGTNSSVLENFLLKRDLMGPCWIQLQNVRLQEIGVSWCKYEIAANNPKNISRFELPLAEMPPTPPVTVASLSLKTTINPKTRNHEIVMASMIIQEGVQIDEPSTEKTLKTSYYTAARGPGGNDSLPVDLRDYLRSLGTERESRFRIFVNERALLSFVLATIQRVDPDVLLGHNITGFDLSMLLHRIDAQNLPNWSRLGRIRRSIKPRLGAGVDGKGTYMGVLTAGRLLCDTYLGAREHLRETSYALTPLAKSRLSQTRIDVDPLDVPRYFLRAQDTFWLGQHTENDAYLALQLMYNMQLLPLTKQLTNLAGNLWSRTLRGSRAERIEYLLLHEFHRLKFIVPDKQTFQEKGKRGQTQQIEGTTGDNEDINMETTKKQPKRGNARRKPAYSGGLVLEPKKGLYDKYVLLLDFNSLYPSIIQEFNICFTTVQRQTPVLPSPEDDTTEDPATEIPPLPDRTLYPDLAILPRVIRTLVMRRRQIKSMLKTETDQTVYRQLDIRQMALKILANSMYGCLGFANSRFFARPLAALVTSQGREILGNTVDLAEKTLGLEVIYGDTDSIMLYTNSTDIAEVKQMGNAVKREVNKRYKMLEIEIDGIYAMMLLLKKKKYAALTLNEGPPNKDGSPNFTLKKETKGLDLVRRDWCVLSREFGKRILDVILSKREREDVVTCLHDMLTQLATSARNGDISLDQFVVTKGLNKSPRDYPDAKSQPHLQVALRMLAQNKLVNVGDHIPYIICQQTYSEFETLQKEQQQLKSETKSMSSPTPGNDNQTFQIRSNAKNETDTSLEKHSSHGATGTPVKSGRNSGTTLDASPDKTPKTKSGSSAGSNRGAAERAFHPDEVRKYSDLLTVDIEWYLGNQILPPISRLCEPIEGTSSTDIATCLGLDPSRYGNSSSLYFDGENVREDEGYIPTSILADEERFEEAEPIITVCTSCNLAQPFAGVVHTVKSLAIEIADEQDQKSLYEKIGVYGVYCRSPNCTGIVIGCPPQITEAFLNRYELVKQENMKAGLPAPAYSHISLYIDTKQIFPTWNSLSENHQIGAQVARFKNLITVNLRRHIRDYMMGWMQCEDRVCGLMTRAQTTRLQGSACPREGCSGKLHLIHSSRRLHTQIEYYSTLFNKKRTDKLAQEAGESKDEIRQRNYPAHKLAENLRELSETTITRFYDTIFEEIQQYLDRSAYHFVACKELFAYTGKLKKHRKTRLHVKDTPDTLSSGLFAYEQLRNEAKNGVAPLAAMTVTHQ